MTATRTVFLGVPRGRVARYFFQSAVVETLRSAGVRVIVLTPSGASSDR